MRNYSLSLAQAFSHIPDYPERTAYRDIYNQYRVFPTTDAMYTFLCKGTNGITWSAWKDTPAGYRWKQSQAA